MAVPPAGTDKTSEAINTNLPATDADHKGTGPDTTSYSQGAGDVVEDLQQGGGGAGTGLGAIR